MLLRTLIDLIPPYLFYEYGTLEDLLNHLLGQLSNGITIIVDLHRINLFIILLIRYIENILT